MLRGIVHLLQQHSQPFEPRHRVAAPVFADREIAFIQQRQFLQLLCKLPADARGRLAQRLRAFKAPLVAQEGEKLQPYLRAVQALVRTMPQLGADARRLYAAGISMGGYGVWRLVMDDPHLFAAAVPICGGADPARAASLTDLPLWTFHGGDDPTVPVSGTREMAAAIRAAGGTQLRYTEYPHTGHESWLTAYQEPELLPWLFSQVDPCPRLRA